MADVSTVMAKNIPHHSGAARERLLLAACDLFCRYGINATGVDSIVEAAGTAKTTLYKAFGSKEGLIEAVLAHEGQSWRDWFSNEIDAYDGAPAEKLLHVFAVLKRWFQEDSFYGCPFINAVGEHDKEDDRIRLLTIQHKTIVLNKITSLTADVRPEDPEGLTHELALLIDGAIVAALVTKDATVADHARNAARRLLT
ncbi:MAG: TetR/AcrR family transcriptional regulator [Pseudomonadota bacterium]